MRSERSFMPAAGRDLFLPLYDPLTRLMGMRSVHAVLLDGAGLQPHFRVLDVGCGTGTLATLIKQVHPDVEVVALDPDPRALARAERKVRRAGVPIQIDRGFSDTLPYESAVFDRVFSSMMFHHLRRSERETSLREIYRVLKPGGRLELLDFAGSGSHAHGLLARMIHPQQQLRDTDHARLLDLMSRAGFATPRCTGDRKTLFGPVAFYQATKNMP